MSRTSQEIADELAAINEAHAQNESGRDAFVALAHTALFAASVSFVGDVAPLTTAVWRPALVSAWLADVIGLLALTLSFGASRRLIDACRAAIHEPAQPVHRLPNILNGIALWSFPIALLCLFAFVTANVVNTDDAEESASSATTPEPRAEGHRPAGASSESAIDGRHPGTAGTCPTSSAAEEVGHVLHRLC